MKETKRVTISIPAAQLWKLKVLSLCEDRAVSHQIITMMDYYIKTKNLDLSKMASGLVEKEEKVKE